MLTQTHKTKHAAMHVEVSKERLLLFFFFFAAETHIKIRGNESEKQMAIQMQPVDLFMCLPLCGEYRNSHRVPIMDYA